MWFDILSAIILISAIGREIIRGGRAISPTRLTWLIAVGIFTAFGGPVVSKFHIAHNTLEYILIVAVILNIIFIVPSIVATAVIQTAFSVFLIAFVLQFIPEYAPKNSWLYPLFQPLAAKAYVLVKPFVDKYIEYLKSKIVDLKNLDISKVKPTLPPSSGGEFEPTLPKYP